jgi:HK97 family phage prohead protease
MSEAKATSTAIATATLFCKSGRSPNLPVTVNAASRAEACQAVTELQAINAARRPKRGPSPVSQPEQKPPEAIQDPPSRPVEPKPKPEPGVAEKVTDAAWDGSPSRFSDAEYARSCVLDRGASVASTKDRYSLPVREPDGTLNRNGVHAAAGRIGSVKASPEAVRAAARALVALYRGPLGETPPDGLLKLAGLAAVAAAAKKPPQDQQQQRDLPDEKVEVRSAPDSLTLDGPKLRGRIPYGVESRKLPGSWTEVIKPGAFAQADMRDLVATVDHGGIPLARYPTTLDIEDRSDGLHWSLTLPESRADVREAVERGDLNASSWSMVVAADTWQGSTRFVTECRALRDVSVVVTGAYPKEAAFAEMRAHEEEEIEVELDEGGLVEPVEEEIEARSEGTLRISDRNEGGDVERRDLLGMFRAAGWTPRERTEIPWTEFEQCVENRALVWSGSLDTLQYIRRDAALLGADQRYAWPAFQRVAVDSGVTAVQVVAQSARVLPDPETVIRTIAATTPKAEVETDVGVSTVSMSQVAAVVSGIPNVYMLNDQLRSLVGTDLRLSLNEGLDDLVLDALETAGHQAPGTDALLVSIRKCITTIQAVGYSPDTLILRPADAEALDTLTSSGPEKFYVFGPAKFAPGTLFGLNIRIAKNAAAPIVCDASAFGTLYGSPVALQTFEENFGKTNTSLLRLEGHAGFGIERPESAVRIAAS